MPLECPHRNDPPTGIRLSQLVDDQAMAGKRDKPEEIALKQRKDEVLQGHGGAILHSVRHMGVTQLTYQRFPNSWIEGQVT